MAAPVQLEPEAREFAQATGNPPFPFELPPAKGCQIVDEVQSSPVDKPAVDVEDRTIPGGVSVKILRPRGAAGALPAVVYIHGAGWVFGNAHTHDRLIRELAARGQVAVVFPNYSLSPEARYPVAIEESYATVKWVAEHGREHGLDGTRLTVSGDSVGGNMAIAMTLMAKARGGPAIQRQLLFYPVTDAAFEWMKTDLALAGIASCLYLMDGLPAVTWKRFGIWLLAGLVIYYLYGFSHSKLHGRRAG